MTKRPTDSEIAKLMSDVLRNEAQQIERLAEALPASMVEAAELLFKCEGRVIVTGMGKMSAIARKTAATLCSVGTPAVFLHPSEALHGDLGIVSSQDVLLAISNSGETGDILGLVPFMKRHRVPIVSVTNSDETALAQVCDVSIATGVTNEADSITAAPTNSTTASLAICDALAIALVHLRGFTPEQFATFHPAGSLGRQLLLRVNDLMVTGDEIPTVAGTATLREAIVAISRGKMGAGFVVDSNNILIGVITDGDLRRTLEAEPNPLDQSVTSSMTKSPHTIHGDALAVAALNQMNDKQITVLPVTDEQSVIVGGLHLHDLLQAGLGQADAKSSSNLSEQE